jgi:hypothetical protein
MTPERAIADSLEAEVSKRNEWYGLDNWSMEAIAEWVLNALTDAGFQVVRAEA